MSVGAAPTVAPPVIAGPNGGDYVHIGEAQMQADLKAGTPVWYQQNGNWVQWHPGVSGVNIYALQGIGSPTANGMSSAQTDAWATLQNLLAGYGFTGQDLTSLVQWAKGQIIAGYGADLITLNLQQTPQFKARFPAIEELAKQGVAISPAEYISLEQSYASIEQAAGLPPNFASFDRLIAGQVSPTEYQSRVTDGYLAVAQKDPTVIQAFQDYYGIGANQLAAYMLNPAKSLPMLQQQAIAAQIGGASAQAGFNGPTPASALPQPVAGNRAGVYTPGVGYPSAQFPSNTPAPFPGITEAEARRLAQMGVTQSQAQQGFQKLATERQLYNPLPGAGQGMIGNPLTTDQLLNAQFGADGQTQMQLELQAQFEKGTTAQGTEVASTSSGATGLGAVQR